MNESIVISFTKLANPVDVDGFIDVLSDTLSEQGSTPAITAGQVSPYSLDGNQFRVVWTGSYSFTTPDGFYTFSETDLRVEVEVHELNYNALMVLLGARARLISEAYRSSLRGIFNVATNVANGSYVPSNNMDGSEYIRDTLEAALAAFPNSN